MSLDPPFVAEFAEAGFLRPFTTAEAAGLTALGHMLAVNMTAPEIGALRSGPFSS